MINSVPVSPSLWLGGGPLDYKVEILKNGGWGTRHLSSNQVLPHVLANPDAEEIMQSARVLGGGMSSLPMLGKANLALGLLNLGVSAWTAWKVHKMDKKIDALTEDVQCLNRKMDGLSTFMEASVTQLETMIKSNSILLGLVIENQGRMAAALDQLALEVRNGFASIESTLMTAEARRESHDLEERMRALLRYYRNCTRALEKSNEPSRSDLRQIVDGANQIVAWVDTRLGRIGAGHSERIPLFVVSALAHHLEYEARTLSKDAPPTFEEQYFDLRDRIRNEIETLTTGGSVYDLAIGNAGAIEHYVFLDRALRGPPTMIEFDSGALVPYRPTNSMTWNDGLDAFRGLLSSSSDEQPVTIPIDTLPKRRAWNVLSGLPYEAFDDIVDTQHLKACLGIPANSTMSEETLGHLLVEGPRAHEELTDLISRELDPC